MGSKNFGYTLLKRVIADLGEETISLDVEPKFIGRHLGMVISPLNRARKVEVPTGEKNG
jgi:translation initiation factor IF-3